MYKITIEKYKDNTQYDPEKVKENNRYGRDYNSAIAEPFILHRSLQVDLTDEEFAVVKKAVLEVM